MEKSTLAARSIRGKRNKKTTAEGFVMEELGTTPEKTKQHAVGTRNHHFSQASSKKVVQRGT